MQQRREMSLPGKSKTTDVLAVVGAGAAILLCCAGPALLAGGVLSGLGALLLSPWLIGCGSVLVAVAIGYAIVRHSLRRKPRDEPGR